MRLAARTSGTVRAVVLAVTIVFAALALSDDEGATWKWKRHLERSSREAQVQRVRAELGPLAEGLIDADRFAAVFAEPQHADPAALEAVAQWRAGKVRPLCVFDSKPLADLVQATKKSGSPLASGTYSAGYELVAKLRAGGAETIDLVSPSSDAITQIIQAGLAARQPNAPTIQAAVEEVRTSVGLPCCAPSRARACAFSSLGLRVMARTR